MDDEEVPDAFLCPITGDTFVAPVVARDGHSYDRAALQEWFDRGHRTSPLTNLALTSTNVIPNLTLRKAIEEEGSRKRKREKEEKDAVTKFQAHCARTIRGWGQCDGLAAWLAKVRMGCGAWGASLGFVGRSDTISLEPGESGAGAGKGGGPAEARG